jgi:hypothetical protein
MSLADDLAKLDELRRSGALNEAEFQEAAAGLFSRELGSAAPTQIDGTPRQPDDANYQIELARIDREWQRDERYYMVRTGMDRRQVPTTTMAFYLVVIGGGIGVAWVIITLTILRSMAAIGPLALMRVVFPLIGVVYTIVVVGYGLYCYRRARLYQERYREYQARRQKLKARHFQ